MKRSYSAMLAKLLAVVMMVTALLVTLPAINVSAADNFIITLDPGHGPDSSGTPGAVQFGGLNEYLYTYMLANLVKERLLQYEGVTVYFTRTETETPGLAERAKIAAGYKSDAFISIHNNASGNGTSKGAMILVPNENYRPEISKASCAAANIILDQMVADTGVKNLGLLFKQGSGTYPDGSTTDYYGIIKNGKLENIPVVMLIETAYADNQEDYYNHLATEAARKRSAYAIADGIAKAFNFTPKAGADLSKPEAPVIPEFTEIIKFHSSVDHVNGRGPNGSANFAGKGGNTGGGSKTIDAVSENVTVKEDGTLSIGGWLGVDGGTARYVYSIDGGKTWQDVQSGGYDGEPLAGHYNSLGFENATKNGMFHINKAPLVADLSVYSGYTLNVTFGAVAAKDNKTVIPFITIENYTVPGEPSGDVTLPTQPDDTTEPEVTPDAPDASTPDFEGTPVKNFRYKGVVSVINGVQYELVGYRDMLASPKVHVIAEQAGVTVGTDGKLTLTGWAFMNGGQNGIYWSLDGEKWYAFSGTFGAASEDVIADAKTSDAQLTDAQAANATFADVVADLSAYAGKTITVQIAVGGTNNGLCHFLTLTDVTVAEAETDTSAPEIETTEPDETTAEPEVTTTEPEVTTTEPEVTTTEPNETTAEPEVTTTEPNETTTEPDETTVESEDATTEPEDVTTATAVTTPETDAPAKEGGCGSAVSGALAIVSLTTAAGALFLARKKED